MIRVNIDDLELEYVGADAGGGSIFEYKNEFFTGIMEEFHDNGNLSAEFEFKDGHANGKQKTYFENGQVKHEYYVRYNRSYDSSRLWNENGDLLLQVDYDDDGNEISRFGSL